MLAKTCRIRISNYPTRSFWQRKYMVCYIAHESLNYDATFDHSGRLFRQEAATPGSPLQSSNSRVLGLWPLMKKSLTISTWWQVHAEYSKAVLLWHASWTRPSDMSTRCWRVKKNPTFGTLPRTHSHGTRMAGTSGCFRAAQHNDKTPKLRAALVGPLVGIVSCYPQVLNPKKNFLEYFT